MATDTEAGEPGKGKFFLDITVVLPLTTCLNKQLILSSLSFYFLICKMPFKLLGILDVQNVPCARDSLLYGSLGSVVAGFGHFLLTSRIRRSCDIAVGVFILGTLGCWFPCRYNFAKQRIQQRVIQEGIKNKILFESTHLDPERKQIITKSSSS